ncbi:MAG: hypothetical protein Q9227_008796 [Pyrenula ochraceoflavens]
MNSKPSFDGTAYWKQAYESSEATHAKLLDRIHELENAQNPAFEGTEVAVPAVTDKGKKKRQAAVPAQKANSQAKRRATSNQVQLKAPFYRSCISENMEASKTTIRKACLQLSRSFLLTIADQRFLRQFFNLKHLLNDRSFKPDCAAKIVSGMCQIARDMIYDLIHQWLTTSNSLPDGNRHEEVQLKTTFTALHDAFSSIIKVMHESHENHIFSPYRQSMTVSTLELLVYILDELHGVCAIRTEKENDSKVRLLRPSTSKPKAAKTHEDRNQAHEKLAEWLAEVLFSLIQCVEMDEFVYGELFEGYCCIFLDRVGQILSLQVFAQDSSNIPKSAHPSLKQPTRLKNLKQDQLDIKIQTSRFESQLLVRLLEQIMGIVSRYQRNMTTMSQPMFSFKKNTADSNPTFTAMMNRKLQNSLLKGVFGHDDSTFRESLINPKPASYEAPDNMHDSEEETKTGEEWFLGEVWKLVGWDFLSGLQSAQDA